MNNKVKKTLNIIKETIENSDDNKKDEALKEIAEIEDYIEQINNKKEGENEK